MRAVKICTSLKAVLHWVSLLDKALDSPQKKERARYWCKLYCQSRVWASHSRRAMSVIYRATRKSLYCSFITIILPVPIHGLPPVRQVKRLMLLVIRPLCYSGAKHSQGLNLLLPMLRHLALLNLHFSMPCL